MWLSHALDDVPVERLQAGDTIRAAIMDTLIENTDRQHNWLGIGDDNAGFRLKIIDHGHAFGIHPGTVNSLLVDRHRGEQLPSDVLDALQQLVGGDCWERIGAYLDESAVADVKQRAEHLLMGRSLQG